MEKIEGNAQVEGCGIAIMSRSLKIILILCVILLILPSLSIAGQFRVVRVYDGDTLKAVGHDIEIKVRLVGIDAPETSKKKNEPGQPFSKQATKYLANLVLNETVEIKGYGLDRYNRILGEVFVGSWNVNLEMIKAGLAEVYRGKPPRGFDLRLYQESESKAKKSKLGMWELGDKYMSPKEWRKMRRKDM